MPENALWPWYRFRFRRLRGSDVQKPDTPVAEFVERYVRLRRRRDRRRCRRGGSDRVRAYPGELAVVLEVGHIILGSESVRKRPYFSKIRLQEVKSKQKIIFFHFSGRMPGFRPISGGQASFGGFAGFWGGYFPKFTLRDI